MSDFDRPGDVFLADCPARMTLELLADTWSLVVVFGLGQGPRRFSELGELIGGVSKKMLSQTLRKLERNGLVDRRVIPAAPVRVEYRLTALGCSLLDPVSMLSRWAETNAEHVMSARDAADGREAATGT
jgi:DNA-binding HxlR family transcriptional regulator